MRKQSLKSAIAAMLALVCAIPTVACGSQSAGWKYPDRANTVLAEGEFSWEKWKQECPEGLTINWYCDVNNINISDRSVVTKVIKEKTGITVNFDYKMGGGTDKLSVMIGADTLPDVVSIERADQRYFQLANEGYLFPINGLAEKWAPTLHIQQDIFNTSALKDGNVYGLPSYYYSTDETYKLQTNGGMMIRKDWYEAYMEHVIDSVPAAEQSEWDITSPQGLIKAMKWVRDNCLTKSQKNTYNAFVLDPFDTTKNNGNQGIAWLCQYWAIPYEDAETGEYIDGIDTRQYKEMMKWLNELYREELLSANALNMTTFAEVGKLIQNGNAFVVCGSPQNYSQYLMNAAFPRTGEGIEYVSFVMRNNDGDDPVLGDIAGSGYTMSCITKNAKRPDIIIKLFDYLWSDEGQLLCQYGLEGATDESGNVTALKDTSLSSDFGVKDATWYRNAAGEVKRTDAYLRLSATEGVSDEQKAANQAELVRLGLSQWTLFNRPNFYNALNTGKKSATKQSAYVNNMKLPLTMYSTSYYITGNLINVLEDDYTDNVKIRDKMNTIWSPIVISMIQATDSNKVDAIFANGRARLTSNGHDTLYAAYARGYRIKKQNQNISWGYPHNDPSYKEKTISEGGVYSWEKNGKTYTDIFGARGDINYYEEYDIVK